MCIIRVIRIIIINLVTVFTVITIAAILLSFFIISISFMIVNIVMFTVVIIILVVAVRIGGVRHFCLSARDCSCGLIPYIATGVPALKTQKRFHLLSVKSNASRSIFYTCNDFFTELIN